MATCDDTIVKLKATLDERLPWGRDRIPNFGLKWSKDGLSVLYDGISSDEALRCMIGIANDKTPLLSQLLDWGFQKSIDLHYEGYQRLGFYRYSSMLEVIKGIVRKGGSVASSLDSSSSSFEPSQLSQPGGDTDNNKQPRACLDVPHHPTSDTRAPNSTISTPSPKAGQNRQYRASLIKDIQASIENLKVWNKDREVSLPQLRSKLRVIIVNLLDNEINEETREEQKKLKDVLEQDVDKNPIYVGWVLGAVENQLSHLI